VAKTVGDHDANVRNRRRIRVRDSSLGYISTRQRSAARAHTSLFLIFHLKGNSTSLCAEILFHFKTRSQDDVG
jgi:hypothetical protein